jgi:DNA/RNA endonuclease YhcR with UshA esterase domain
MKLERIFFILSIVGILILILISQITVTTHLGKIKSVQRYNNRIIIKIENSSKELVLFEESFINLKTGDTIEFQGKQDTYRGKEQIIINKIKRPN